MTINEWLLLATKELKIADISSARLDAELILSHTIRKPRTYLHAHGNELLDERREAIANARLQMRIERTPLAYIIGHKEFTIQYENGLKNGYEKKCLYEVVANFK